MKAHGQFKRRAHIASLIGVHVAVGQRCVAVDGESSAILPTMSTRNVPVGRWKEGLNKSKRRAHIASLIRIHVSVGQRCRAGDVEPAAILPKKQARNVPAGAMDESPGEVQDASHT